MSTKNPFIEGMMAELGEVPPKTALSKLTEILEKGAKHFVDKDVPEHAKKIYTAIKRKMPEMRERYGKRAKEVAARTALKNA